MLPLVATLPFLLMAATVRSEGLNYVLPATIHGLGNYADYRSSKQAFALGAIETKAWARDMDLTGTKLTVAVGATGLDLGVQALEREAGRQRRKKTKVAIQILKWGIRGYSIHLYYKTYDNNRKVASALALR